MRMLIPTTQASANAVARVEKMTSGYTISGQGRKKSSNRERSLGNGDQSFSCCDHGFLETVSMGVMSEVSDERCTGCWSGLEVVFSSVFTSLIVLEGVSGSARPCPARLKRVSGHKRTTTRKLIPTRIAAIILCHR